jgi:hypothetical protein
MDDVLIQGGNREPSWRARILTAIAVLLVLTFVIATHLPHGRPTPAHRRAATVTAGPVQLAGLGSGAAGLLDGAARNHRTGPALDQQSRAAAHFLQ